MKPYMPDPRFEGLGTGISFGFMGTMLVLDQLHVLPDTPGSVPVGFSLQREQPWAARSDLC